MEKYTKAQMEVIEFEAEDVITTSGCNGMDRRYQKSCVPASEQCEHRRDPESFE